MEACSIEQACCYALAAFLQERFDADERFQPPGLPKKRCLVQAEWPAGNLPPRALSIVMAGERQDTHLTEEVVRRTDLPNNQGEFTWSVKAITQPLQLDVWAKTDQERDMIGAALDKFLHLGTRFTLSDPRGSITRDGPLLRLDPVSGHQGFATFMFEGPRRVDDGTAALEREFRSMRRGSVDAELSVTATTAKIALVKLQGALDAAPYEITLQKEGTALGIAAAQL